MRLRVFAGGLMCLGLLLLTGASLLFKAGRPGTLIGESLAALIVIAIVAMISLRNVDSPLERSRRWLHAGSAYLFVCVLIVLVGVSGDGTTVPERGAPATPKVAASQDTDASVTPVAGGAPKPGMNPASEAEQIRKILSAAEERSAALQIKYRNLLSPGYFVRLLAPGNLADSTTVGQARLLLARLADSADGYAAEVASEGKVFIEQIQSANLTAASKGRYVQAVQQVELARQADVRRWIAAKRDAIDTALGILTLVDQADYAVAVQDDLIAFDDRLAGDRYEILVEQLRSQDARARAALRAMLSRDQQIRDALALPN